MRTVSVIALFAAMLVAAVPVSITSASARGNTGPSRPICNGFRYDPACDRKGPAAENRDRCPTGQAMRSGRCLPLCAIGIVNSCKSRG